MVSARYALNLVDESPACYDTELSGADTGGDKCAWYAEGTNYFSCGAYDDDDFRANEMCCACSGGSPTPLNTAIQCVDQNRGAKDNGGDGCDWYGQMTNSLSCGGYDDADFDAGSMCCACGGGEDQLVLVGPEVIEEPVLVIGPALERGEAPEAPIRQRQRATLEPVSESRPVEHHDEGSWLPDFNSWFRN